MPRRRKLIWQIYPPFLLVVLISLVILMAVSTALIRDVFLDRLIIDLHARSMLIGQLIFPYLRENNDCRIQAMADSLGKVLNCRVTVVLPTGEVAGDSDETPANMDNHGDRPEIRAAFSGGPGQSSRFSYTLGMDMMYVASAVDDRGEMIGAVRTSMPVGELNAALKRLYRPVFLVGLCVSVLAGLITYSLSRRIRKPVEALQRGMIQFGGGRLDYHIHIENPEEFAILSQSMNAMAGQLNKRIGTITEQRNELEAILSSMVESVIMVNMDERIVRLNRAAAVLFQTGDTPVQGRAVQEVIRHPGVQQFIHSILTKKNSGSDEITMYDEKERFLQAHGSIVHDADNHPVGALVVLNDITRMRRLENIRREFVANVSHELRTPVTSIRGFVETLQGGALNDAENAGRFLDIISAQTGRLSAIIEDLLRLSRLEQGAENQDISLEKQKIGPILARAVQTARQKAEKSGVTIVPECPESLEAFVNAPLFEQAVFNLVDNAVRYSEDGGRVAVSAGEESGEVVVTVQDRGSGIAAEHLPRIFERFYRVDKARTRDQGGTGLGLAIVKHIVQAHGGRVTVESRVGEGSVFRIHLPAEKS